jgi:hypothetical protein
MDRVGVIGVIVVFHEKCAFLAAYDELRYESEVQVEVANSRLKRRIRI